MEGVGRIWPYKPSNLRCHIIERMGGERKIQKNDKSLATFACRNHSKCPQLSPRKRYHPSHVAPSPTKKRARNRTVFCVEQCVHQKQYSKRIGKKEKTADQNKKRSGQRKNLPTQASHVSFT